MSSTSPKPSPESTPSLPVPSEQLPLISEPFETFTPESFHKHVTEMHELRQRGSKPVKPQVAEGLTLSRTKKGALSVRRNKNKRAWDFVTRAEIEALAKDFGAPLNEVWALFSAKKYVIANDKLEAERINITQGEIPW